MSIIAALPMAKKLQLKGIIATFVVPAPNGCNLNCPFCIVRARHEAPPHKEILSSEDYVQFLEAMTAKYQIGVMSIQGQEPLLPESWPYSEALLKRATELGIMTALITNGTHLREHIADLESLGVAGVTVSLDSSVPELHDHSRRTHGAYASTLSGLHKAASSSLRDSLVVASILQPGCFHYLLEMPKLLASLGIDQWVVTPLQRIERHKNGGPVQQYAEIMDTLFRLYRTAEEHGIEMVVDDEFEKWIHEKTSNVVPIAQPRFRRLPKLSQVFRLTPTGSCSIGEAILRRIDNQTPHWRPGKESAVNFLDRLPAGKAYRRSCHEINASI